MQTILQVSETVGIKGPYMHSTAALCAVHVKLVASFGTGGENSSALNILAITYTEVHVKIKATGLFFWLLE